ncbi:glycoside hydrolase family 3 N-terminal domain-containing protein [Microbacterium aurantiacum]|uniref:glycoside hydrolase family 3 N-terminal domain-containing protein n=1 Tax=Microbacterium aurantiacum TaxID=162393 RepID=UPI000C804B86|nr:glycoside hydrolase family 3 N-terminal domain-containing protein [Microbacterium aurantiacum]
MRRSLSVRVAGALLVAVAATATALVSPAQGRHDTVDASPERGPAQRAAAMVSTMSLQEQAASVVMGHIPTTDASTLSAYMAQGGLGGFILMGSNVPGTEEELRAVTAALTTDPALPPLIAIDQEGGSVSRLGWDGFPAATTLKDATPASTSAAFAGRASLVVRGGANVNFGIVADTTADRSSFIFDRSLGADPTSAADRVAAAVTAEEQFLASTLKHFPGHGAAPGDSHQLIPSTGLTLEQWRAADALPFIAGIDAGASLLMFGHLAYTAVDAAPASLSARWHEIARGELGFEGVIVTDDLGMLESTGIAAYADPVANAVAALAAGSDMVLTIAHSTPDTAAQVTAGLVAAVEAGTLPAERLQDAAERVLTLRLEIAASDSRWAPCADCEPAS